MSIDPIAATGSFCRCRTPATPLGLISRTCLNKEPIVEYVRSNITLMKWMIAEGYQDAHTLKRRINAMEDWIANGTLLKADANAQYAAIIEIDLAEVTEPILACPNRVCQQRDDAKAADVYRYMNFDQIPEFVEQAATVEM